MCLKRMRGEVIDGDALDGGEAVDRELRSECA